MLWVFHYSVEFKAEGTTRSSRFTSCISETNTTHPIQELNTTTEIRTQYYSPLKTRLLWATGREQKGLRCTIVWGPAMVGNRLGGIHPDNPAK